MLLAAVGVDGKGGKHPLGVIEGGNETPSWRRPCWTT